MKINFISFLTILLQCNTLFTKSLEHYSLAQRKQFEAKADRIYGGVEAGRGEFPFMAAVILGDAALCGGALISSTTVLTSAQCLRTSFESTAVHLGLHNLTDDTESGRVIVKASKIIVHEEYNDLNLDNDLGIIKLPISVEASNIIPVALPSRSLAEGNLFENYKTKMFGWGLTSSDPTASYSDFLKIAEPTVISNDWCEKLYELFSYVTPYKICVDNYGYSGACLGDAGGPIVVKRPEDDQYVVIGTISFSGGPCGYNLPVIAARLSLYLDWIEVNAGVIIEA